MRIRPASLADAAAFAAIYGPIVSHTATSFEIDPPSADEMATRIAKAHAWLTAEIDGVVAGYAYAAKHRDRAAYQWSVDVSVYVSAQHRGLGVGCALYDELFLQLIARGFYTAYAGITLPNAASVGLHEACGFRPIGVYTSVGFKLGAWHDVGWWQRELRPRVGTPAPPS